MSDKVRSKIALLAIVNLIYINLNNSKSSTLYVIHIEQIMFFLYQPNIEVKVFSLSLLCFVGEGSHIVRHIRGDVKIPFLRPQTNHKG